VSTDPPLAIEVSGPVTSLGATTTVGMTLPGRLEAFVGVGPIPRPTTAVFRGEG